MFENDHNSSGMENSQFGNYETSVSGVENVTRKSKGRKAALIGGISAAVLVGGSTAAYAASDTVKNQVKLRVSRPEKYYAWVTENNSRTIGEAVSEYYRKQLDNYEKGLASDISISFEPTQEGKDAILDQLYYDPQPLTDVIKNNDSYCFTAGSKNRKCNIDLSLGLDMSGKHIASFDMAADKSAADYFLRVPELNEQWLCIEGSKDEQEHYYGISGIMQTYKALLEDPASFLSPDELRVEVDRYARVWSSFADEVQLEKKETVDICDISVDYTVATVRLSEKDLRNLAVNYLEEAKDDEILKNIVINKLRLFDDVKEYEDDIDDEINDLREELENNDFDSDFELTIDTYIDLTGTIRGFGFSGNDDSSFILIFGKEGDKVRGECNAFDGDECLFAIKLCAEENKKVYSGELSFTYSAYSFDYDEDINDYAMVKKDMNAVAEFSGVELRDNEKGYFNGDFSLNIPGREPVDISCSTDGRGENIAFDIKNEDVNFGKLRFSYSFDFGAAPEIPDKSGAYMIGSDSISDLSFEDYVSKDRFSDFIKTALTDIGLNKGSVEDVAEDIIDDIYDDINWYSDDFDTDIDYDDYDFDDFDWDDDTGFEFGTGELEYDDFKSIMTEEEFNDMIASLN